MADDQSDGLLQKEKTLLEVRKLRAEDDDRGWRRPMERKKAEREVRLLLLQHVQHVAIAVGAIVTALTFSLSYCTYRRSVDDARRREFRGTVERFRQGSTAAIPELMSFEDFRAEAVEELIAAVEPLPSPSERAWPALTNAALIALRGHELTPEQRQRLMDKMLTNYDALNDFAGDLEEPMGPKERAGELRTMVCVQLNLQMVLERAPTGWPATRKTVLRVNGRC
jgi:hypothetical protein